MFNFAIIILLFIITQSFNLLPMGKDFPNTNYSYHTQKTNFQPTNWLALQEIKSLNEGKLPLFYQPQIFKAPLIFPDASARTTTPAAPITPAAQTTPLANVQQISSNSISNYPSACPLRTSCYQDAVLSNYAYNPTSFRNSQQSWLKKQINALMRNPNDFYAYKTRINVIRTEQTEALRTVREAINSPLNSAFNNSEAIAQITESWIHSHEIKFSNPELQYEWEKLLRSVDDALTGECNNDFCCFHDRQKALTKKVDAFEKTLQSWNSDELNICRQALNDMTDYLSSYGNYPSSTQAANITAWKLFNTTDIKSNSIFKVSYHRDLMQMKELLNNGNYTDARHLALHYKDSIRFQHFKAMYHTHMQKQYTPEGIDKRFIQDPLYLAKKNTLESHKENYLTLIHPLNNELLKRYDLLKDISTKLNITDASASTTKFIYDVIEKELNNTSPISITKTFLDLATHRITSSDQAAAIQTSLNYLKLSISEPNSSDSQAFLLLANAQAQAITNPSSSQAIMALADYSQPLTNVHHNEIQKAAVKLIAANLSSKDITSSHDQKIPDWGIIQRVDRAYKEMLNGNIQAEFYLQKGLTPTLNTEVLKVDYDAQMEYFAGIKQDAIVAHVQERKDITTVLLKSGAEFKLQRYELPPTLEKFLIKNGLDPAKFKECFGHQLQHAIHSNILLQIAEQKDISGRQLLDNSNLQQLLKLTTQITNLSREFNSVGQVSQAGMLSNFNWQTMNYIKTAARYGWDITNCVGQGVVQGATSYIRTFTHPHELIQNLYHLSQGFLKVCQGNPILNQMSIFKSHEENLRLAEQYKQEYGPAVVASWDAINERLSKITWRDGVREGTAFLVNWNLSAATLSKLGQVSKIASSHAKEVLRNSPITNPSLMAQNLVLRAGNKAVSPKTIATTAEGIEVQAARAAESCLFSEANQTANNAQKVTQATANETIANRMVGAAKDAKQGVTVSEVATSAEVPQVFPEVAIEAAENLSSKVSRVFQETIEEGVKWAVTDRNKMRHIFQNEGHKLEPLVAKLGGAEETIRAVLTEAQNLLPISGRFEDLVVKVGGYDVYIRGVVIDGIPKIGTMFIK